MRDLCGIDARYDFFSNIITTGLSLDIVAVIVVNRSLILTRLPWLTPFLDSSFLDGSKTNQVQSHQHTTVPLGTVSLIDPTREWSLKASYSWYEVPSTVASAARSPSTAASIQNRHNATPLSKVQQAHAALDEAPAVVSVRQRILLVCLYV